MKAQNRLRRFIKKMDQERVELYKLIYSCWRCQGEGHVDVEGHLPGGGTIPCPECKPNK